MGNKVKRQHVVPVTYLRKFCFLGDYGEVLYSFNKQTKEIDCTQPKKIGRINEFYETVEETQTLEEVFCKFEGQYNILFEKIKGGINKLSREDKETIAKFTSLQFLRSESKKNNWSEMPKILLETEKNIEPSFKKQIEDALNPITLRTRNKEFILKNFELISKIIIERKWILMRNRTDKPFWTSDNPVTLYSPIKFRGLGLISPESELYFPLSPKYCLLICDPKKCENFPSLVESNKDNIEFQRCLQVDYSNRFVFSREEEFSLAKQRINEIPELSKANRRLTKRV